MWIKQAAEADEVHTPNSYFPNHYYLTDNSIYQGRQYLNDALDTLYEEGGIG